ncbi:MAG: helix-turn-helix domain-containing protein [Leptolinea sp.]
MVNQIIARPTIGSRIKEKRLEVGFSIRELAKHAALTASFISQVENEKANVSLDSLRRLSDALGVQMLYFLSEPESVIEDIRIDQPQISLESMPKIDQLFDRTSPHIKKDMRAKLFFPDSGITYELLTSRLNHKMEAFIGEMAPGAENIAGRLNISTEEFVFCLSGVLKIGINDQYYFLEAGDSIYFEGINLTCMASGSDTEATTWLSVITPPAF